MNTQHNATYEETTKGGIPYSPSTSGWKELEVREGRGLSSTADRSRATIAEPSASHHDQLAPAVAVHVAEEDGAHIEFESVPQFFGIRKAGSQTYMPFFHCLSSTLCAKVSLQALNNWRLEVFTVNPAVS